MNCLVTEQYPKVSCVEKKLASTAAAVKLCENKNRMELCFMVYCTLSIKHLNYISKFKLTLFSNYECT